MPKIPDTMVKNNSSGKSQQTINSELMPKSGGVFTGSVTLAGDATAALHPVSKQQLESVLLPYQKMQLIAAKATTSGTFVDFSPADGTGIPSWANKVSILLDSVSTNGSSVPLVQVGAGSVDTTGYLGSTTILTTAQATLQSTQGLPLIQSIAAAWVFSSAMELIQLSSGLWVVRGGGAVISGSTASIVYGGRKPLSGTLDRIRITTVNGTDTFDAGSVSILVEGY